MDTTGAAFTCLVAKVLAGCKVGCYIHYPTISTVRFAFVFLHENFVPMLCSSNSFIVISATGHAFARLGTSTKLQ